MIYRILADSTLLAHLIFILFVLFGGLLVTKWKNIAWLHLPAVVWGVGIEVIGWPCPLTSIENYFLQKSGEVGYHGGFIEQYLLAIIYPDGLTRDVQLILGLIVILLNIIIYFIVWHRLHRMNAD